MIASYILIAISRPGSTDYFQVKLTDKTIKNAVFKYAWIVQVGCGVGGFLNGLQLLNLYPSNMGLLIGLSGALTDLSTFWPQIWKRYQS